MNFYGYPVFVKIHRKMSTLKAKYHFAPGDLASRMEQNLKNYEIFKKLIF